MEVSNPSTIIPADNLIKQLQLENKDLKEKLSKRQDHINLTNAYWKGRIIRLHKKYQKRTT